MAKGVFYQTPPTVACIWLKNKWRTLLFASDYPHWDQDDMENIILPDGWREEVFCNNALAVYPRIAARIQ